MKNQIALYLAVKKRIASYPSNFIGVSLKWQQVLSEDFRTTGCMLNLLTFGEIPPLFGDLKSIENGYIIISNCGGPSAYYGANSNNYKEVLKNLTIMPQCQGKSGGAFGYKGKSFYDNKAAVARLIRKDTECVIVLHDGKL